MMMSDIMMVYGGKKVSEDRFAKDLRSLKLNIRLRRGARTESGALNAHNSVGSTSDEINSARPSDIRHAP